MSAALHSWVVDGSGAPPRLSVASTEQLLRAIDAGALSRALLAIVGEVAPVDYLTIVEYPEARPPSMLEGEANLGDNITTVCFELYRRRFFRYDGATDLARDLRRVRPGTTAIRVLRYRCDEIPNAQWRRDIWLAHELSDRLSLLHSPWTGCSVAFNLYRSAAKGAFRPDEIAGLGALAPLLRQAHILCFSARWQRIGAAQRVVTFERMFARRARVLAPREIQVCARIAVGLTTDRVAADLGIRPSSVRTMRERAYAKLGIHDRVQLALFLG